MGQKANSNLLRFGHNKIWKSEWSGIFNYSSNLMEDLLVRNYLSYVFYCLKCPTNYIILRRTVDSCLHIHAEIHMPEDRRRRFFVYAYRFSRRFKRGRINPYRKLRFFISYYLVLFLRYFKFYSKPSVLFFRFFNKISEMFVFRLQYFSKFFSNFPFIIQWFSFYFSSSFTVSHLDSFHLPLIYKLFNNHFFPLNKFENFTAFAGSRFNNSILLYRTFVFKKVSSLFSSFCFFFSRFYVYKTLVLRSYLFFIRLSYFVSLISTSTFSFFPIRYRYVYYRLVTLLISRFNSSVSFLKSYFVSYMSYSLYIKSTIKTIFYYKLFSSFFNNSNDKNMIQIQDPSTSLSSSANNFIILQRFFKSKFRSYLSSSSLFFKSFFHKIFFKCFKLKSVGSRSLNFFLFNLSFFFNFIKSYLLKRSLVKVSKKINNLNSSFFLNSFNRIKSKIPYFKSFANSFFFKRFFKSSSFFIKFIRFFSVFLSLNSRFFFNFKRVLFKFFSSISRSSRFSSYNYGLFFNRPYMNSSRFFSQFSNLNIAKNIFSSRVVSLKRFSKHYLYHRRRNLHNHLFKSRKYNFHLLNRKFNFFKKKMNTISFELGRHFRQPLSRRVRYIASISKFPSYFLRRLFVSNNAIKTIKTCFSSNSKSFNRHQFAYFRNSFRRRPFFSRGVIRFYTSSLGFIRKRHSFLKSRQILKKKHISTRFIKPKFGISHLKKNIKLNSVSSYYRRRFFFFRKIKHKNYFSKKSILFSTKVGLLKRLLLKRRNHLGYRLNYIQKKLKVVPEVFFSPKTQHYKFFMSKLRSYTRFFIKRMFKSKSRYRHLYKLPLKLRTSNKKSYYRLQRQRRYVSSRPKKYYNRFLLLQSRFFSKKYNPGFKKFMKLKSKIKDNRNKKRVPFILKKNSNAMVNYYNPYYLNSKLYMQFISFIKSGFMPVNFNRSFFLKSFFKKIKRRRHKLFKQRLMYFSNIFHGIKRKKAKKKIGIKRKHKRLCRLFTSNYFRPTSTSVPGINVLNYFSPHFSSNFSSAYSYRFICNLKRLCNRMHSLKFKKKRLKFNNDFLLKVRSLYRRFKKRIKNKTKRSIYSLRSTVPWYSWSHFISNYKTSDNCSNVFRSKPKSRRGFFFDARYRKYMIFKRKPKVKKTMVPSYIRSNYNSRKKNTFGFQRRYYSRFFDKRFSGVKKSKYLNFKNRRKRMPSDLMFRRYYIMNNRYFKNKLSRRVLYFFRRLISSRRRSSFFSFFRLSRPINNFRSIRFYFNRIFSLASKKIRSGSKSSLLESSSYFNYFIFSRFISFIRNINLHSSLSSSYHLPYFFSRKHFISSYINYFSKSMIISSFSRFNSYFNVSSSSKSVLYPIYYNFYSNFNNDFTDQNLLPSFLRFFLKQKISFFFKFYKKFLHSFVVISSYWFNIKSYFYRSFSRLFPYLLSYGNKNYFSVFFFSSIMNKYLFFFNRLFFFRCFLLGFYKSLNVAKFKSSKVRSFISYFSSIFSSKRFVSHKSMYFSKKFKLLRRVYFFNRYNDSRFKRHVAHFTLLNRNRIKKKRFFRRLKLRRHHSKFNTFRSFVRKRIKSRLVFIQDFFRKAIVQFNNTVHFCLSSYLNTSVLLHFRYYIGSSRPLIKSASLVSDFMCYELKKGVPINEVLGDLNFWFRNDRMSKSRLKKKINVHRRGFSKSVRRYDYIDFSSDSLSSYFRNKMLMNNNENRYYLDKLDTFASKFRLNLRYSSFFTVHGFKVVCSGRPFGQPRTTSYLRFFKRMPFSTIDYHVDYSYNYAITKYGMVGIKVWVFFG